MVAGLNDVAKAGPSFEDLRKFPDAEDKEDIESSGWVWIMNCPQLSRWKYKRRKKRRKEKRK